MRGWLFAIAFAFGLARAAAAAAAAEPVQFPELIEVLKEHLAGTSPADLNKAAVNGLLEQLGSRAMIVDAGGGDAEKNVPTTNRVPVSAVYERHFGYVRIEGFGSETGREFRSLIERLTQTNRLRGLVIDLRFARGGDNAAAVAVADVFFDTARELADWGQGARQSSAKSNAVTLPTAVLVNRETAGAAEVLAGILRHGEAALLVGTNTAGQAGATREFTLKTGQRLRVAVAPVKVMGDRELAFTGLKPDILASVDPLEERLFMADAYRPARNSGIPAGGDIASAVTSTNRPRRRMNEAELVRLSREAQETRDRDAAPGPAASPSKALETAAAPAIADPVLARAIDVLKGLSVVQQFRGGAERTKE